MKGGWLPTRMIKAAVLLVAICCLISSEARIAFNGAGYHDDEGVDSSDIYRKLFESDDRRRGKPEIVPEDSFIDEVREGARQRGELEASPVRVYVATRARQLQGPKGGEGSLNDEHLVKESAASDFYFVAIVAGCSAAAVVGVIGAGFCYYKLQKNAKAAAEADYPVYGVTGPNQDGVSPTNGGDRKLAHSAQMYHYQHQKQQMIAMGQNTSDRNASTSDLDSEEENDEGDYTVYECPGLAPTGEMEVKNPLFQDDPTPVLASPPPQSVNVSSGNASDAK